MSGPPRGSRQALRQGRPATTTATAVSFKADYAKSLIMESGSSERAPISDWQRRREFRALHNHRVFRKLIRESGAR